METSEGALPISERTDKERESGKELDGKTVSDGYPVADAGFQPGGLPAISKDPTTAYFEGKLAAMKEKAMTAAIVESPELMNLGNFIDSAQRFCSKQPLHYSKERLWFAWNNSRHAWEMTDEVDILNGVHELLKFLGERRLTQSNIAGELITALRMVARKNAPKEPPTTWLQLGETVWDLETGKNFAATPKYFFTNPIPWEIGDGEQGTPTLDKLFDEWAADACQARSLRELAAYCMLPDYPIHNIFALVGSGSNGKDTYIRFLMKFLGEKNVAATDLDLLALNRFETAKLYRKLVAFVSETNVSLLKRTNILKELSGQSPVRMEFKGKDLGTFQNYAKIVIATNALPTTTDKTIGFYRRWNILDFPHQFDGEKDVLKDIPDWEFRNFAREAMYICQNLVKNRRFTYKATVEEQTEKYEQLSNPLIAFIKEKCRIDRKGKVFLHSFYEAFSAWCEEKGHRQHAYKEVSFKLQALGYERKKEENGVIFHRLVLLDDVADANDDSSTHHIELPSQYNISAFPSVPSSHLGNCSLCGAKGVKVTIGKTGFATCDACRKEEAV